MTIVSQREIARDIFELVLAGELVSEMKEVGQFLNILVPDSSKLLRRPISLSEIDENSGTCTLLYRIGDETSGTRFMSRLKAGERLDVLGPLGSGYDLSSVRADEKIVIIGGGIGVPPLYELAKRLSRTGCSLTVLLGFASKDVKILEEKFAKLAGVSMKIATDDGSYGMKGTVSQLIETLDFRPDAVYSCGAPAMLKVVAEKFAALDRVYLSLESRMACGIGACYACVVPIHHADDKNKTLKVCTDGPVFKASEIELL